MAENAETQKTNGWVIRIQFFPEDGKIRHFGFDALYYQDRSWICDLEKIIPTGEEVQEGELELNDVQSIRMLQPLLGDDFVLVIVPINNQLYLIEVVDGAQRVSVFKNEDELNKYIKETYRVDLSKVKTA